MSSSDESSDFECPALHPLYPGLSNSEQTFLVVGTFVFVGALTAGMLKVYDAMEESSSSGETPPPRWWWTLVKTWPLLGLLVYVPAGYFAHIVDTKGQACIVPPDGTWGWWHMPGSREFHVLWTGYIEMIGGGLLALGGMLDVKKPWARPLRQMSSFVLLLLTIGMTFANAYTLTHGAWAYALEEPLPVVFHFARDVVQALWLSNLYYMASHESLGGRRKLD